MAWFLGRVLLAGLVFAGHVVSLPREGAVGREAQPDAQLHDRERILIARDDALYRRQITITTDVAVQTILTTLGVVGSSTTVVSSTASSAITTTAASSSAASTSTSRSASAASSRPPATTTNANAGSQGASSATAAAASSSSGGGGLSGGAIAGIVIGVVAALAIAGVLGYFLARRRKSHRNDNANMPAFGQGQNQQPPPQAMKEATAPYAGPSTGNGVYTSVTAGYQPAQQQVSHPTFSELPADSRPVQPLQPPQPAYAQQSVPDSPHGRSELETRE